MQKRKEYIRRHANEHQKRHLRLKELLEHMPPKEKVWPLFVATFLIVMFTFVIYANWGAILTALTPEPKPKETVVIKPVEKPKLPDPIQTHGFKTGMISGLKIEEQANQEYRNLLTQIPSAGGLTGVTVTHFIGQEVVKKEENETLGKNIKKTVEASQEISTGQFMTALSQKQARVLQKSLIATYYIGEKSIDVNSTLQNDAKILSQINNALSVDIFAYLNQSANRADSLEGYLNLLTVLVDKTNQRIGDLNGKINFLTANFNAQEAQIKLNEGAFFDHLQMFNGPDAEKSLGEFIGLQENNVEVKAKIGAYNRLKEYYVFFQPRLSLMIEAIKANRDPLIAGVKVVEIQNMQLPLIIRK